MATTAVVPSVPAPEPITHDKLFIGTEGVYLLPHGAQDLIRLTNQHRWLLSNSNGKALADTVSAGSGPLRILDAGCADGHWLHDLRKQLPGCQLDLHGVDIAASFFPPEETKKAAGLDLRIHNLIQPFPDSWQWTNSFDIVHQRLLCWGHRKEAWPTVVHNLCSLVKPGGYLQLTELQWVPRPRFGSDRPLLQKQTIVHEWASDIGGMDIDCAYHLEGWMKDAGLVDVGMVQFDAGYGALAKSPEMAKLADTLVVQPLKAQERNMGADGIPGVAKTPEEYQKFLDDLQLDIRQNGWAPKLNFVYGRKPT